MKQLLLNPPFTLETAKQKVHLIEEAWSTKDPHQIAMVYSKECNWYVNESTLLTNRKEIQEFLECKWKKELDFEVIKTYMAHTDNSIAVQFDYDYRIENNKWFCSYGNEIFEFDEEGLIKKCHMRINHSSIEDSARPISQGLSDILQDL